MTTKDYDKPLIKPYEKKGAALHVERTVQAVLDEPNSIDQTLNSSNEWLKNHFPDTISGNYKNALRKTQIAFGIMGHLAVQRAMPKLSQMLEAGGSPLVPNDIPDSFFDKYISINHWQRAPRAAIESYRTSYWLLEACNEVQDNLENTSHPLHPLLVYADTSMRERHSTWHRWHLGPGRNRWPSTRSNPSESLSHAVNQSFTLNMILSSSLMGANVIYHLHKTNRLDIPSKTLAAAAGEATDTLHRHTSADRHLAWQPDWEAQIESVGYTRRTLPEDGAEALLQCPIDNIVKPNAYAASIKGASMMQDPDFVQHELLRSGSVATSAACSGNVFYRPLGTHREEARHFFEVAGFHPDNGGCFSTAGVALVMAHVALRTILLPTFDENRRKEGIIADQ